MFSKSLVFVVFILAISLNSAIASTPVTAQRTYYGGTVRLTALPSGTASTEKVIVTRTLDQNTNLLMEVACIQAPGKPAQLYPTYIWITGNSAVLSDLPIYGQHGSITGTGSLSGPSWNWNYLNYTIFFTPPGNNGTVRILDVNYMTPNQLIARKQVFYTAPGQAESPVQLWDAELDSLSQDDFQRQYEDMGWNNVIPS